MNALEYNEQMSAVWEEYRKLTNEQKTVVFPHLFGHLSMCHPLDGDKLTMEKIAQIVKTSVEYGKRM